MTQSLYDTLRPHVSEEGVEYATRRLVENIINFRKEIAITPLKTEPLYLTEAAELCVMAETGNMVSNLLSLQEQADKSAMVDWLDKHFGQLIAVSIVLLIPLIYYMVIKN